MLAIAFMLNDRFAFKAESTDKPSMYEYLGLRKTSNASWISTFGNRIAENILELAATEKLWPIIRALSAHFNLDPHVSISYELSQNWLSFDQLKEMNILELTEEIRKLAKYIADKGSYRKNAIIRLEDEDYDKMAAYLKGLESSAPFIPNSEKLIFGHAFSDSTDKEQMQGIQSDYRVLKALQNLNIIKDITLYVYKLGQRYSFEECSFVCILEYCSAYPRKFVSLNR